MVRPGSRWRAGTGQRASGHTTSMHLGALERNWKNEQGLKQERRTFRIFFVQLSSGLVH